jgi:hypothetical protein
MALPYLFLIISIAAFSAGFGTAYKIDQGEVIKLKMDIQTANMQAGELLQSIKEHVHESEETAKIYNEKLDKANLSAIETINGYRDKLATVRLRDPYTNKTSCPGAVSTGANTRINKKNEPDRAELSEQLTKFLQSESYRADQIMIEKNTLLEFVKNNCGIKK